MREIDIVVLREGVYDIPAAEYVTELRDRLPDHNIEYAQTPAEERRLVTDADVVTGPDVSQDLLQCTSDLRLFACTNAGYEYLPLDALGERDVTVTNASGVHAPTVAEHAIGGILAFAHRFPTAIRRQRDHEWRMAPGSELAGGTVAVVGLGAIGQAVVDRLDPFDVTTIGVRHTPEKGGPTDEVFGYNDLHDALARAEYIVIACPLTEATEELLGQQEFETISPDAVIVNVARGSIIDTDALVSVLSAGHLRGAMLDVTDPEPLPPDHPLWRFGNVVITPHEAGYTSNYYQRCTDILAENVERLSETGSNLGLRNQIYPK